MSKKKLLKKSDIYAIADVETCQKSISRFTQDLIKNNVKIIQLRDKNSLWQKILQKAHLLKEITKDKAVLIINDYPEICILTDACGVHLGQTDLSLEIIRTLLGKDKIIGISCHNLKQAEIAQKEGADYISFGPIFKTPLKKEYKAIGLRDLSLLKKKIKIPFFLIGGIDTPQAKILRPFRIKRIAVCRALCQTKNLDKKIKQLRNYLN